MSDTEDTEEFIQTKKISSTKNLIISEVLIQKEELQKISTIEIISDLLVNICEENKTKKNTKNYLLKSFTNKNVPSISIKDYLFRLSKHAKVNESTIILILIYIDRICKINDFILTFYNIHKLILAAFILAIKYNEENYYSMDYYSKLGGIPLSELNYLESEYLNLIGFSLFVQTKLFNKYYNDLMSLKNDDNEDESESEGEYEEEEEDEKEGGKESEIDKKMIKNNNIDIIEELYQNEKVENKNNVNNINCERAIIRP